jgi:serine/threonine protein kinase
MFQHTYTRETDVWSVGVVLYVLVAGYPADELQMAFNILQKSKGRDIKSLPNLPGNMPDTYYEMLEQLLTYHHNSRPSADEMLKNEFVQFHKLHVSSPRKTRSKISRTASVHFQGSVERHGIVLGYESFERAITTILATMLNNIKLCQLVAVLESKDKNHSQNKFKVISISKLRTVLEDMHHRECVDMIGNLPNARTYDSFAYHVAFLKQFSRGHPVNGLSTKGRQPTRMSISGGTVMTTELHVSKKDSFSNFPRSKQTVATSVVVGGSGDQIRVDLDALKAFQLSAITNGPVETKKESRNGFAGLERLIEEGLEEEDDTFPTFETLEEGEHVC